MKAIIFAGGVGTRLWPLSRRRSPKQFEKVIGEKSTLQLAVERLLPDFAWDDIYIATSSQYEKIVAEQLPKLTSSHIICEPESRDVGPAVGLVSAVLTKIHPREPIAIVWSDHLVRKDALFRKILSESSKIVSQKPNKIIFISQKPRFASQNLGWIKYGKKVGRSNGFELYAFDEFHYRPDLETADKFYKSGNFAWNVGYFVTTPSFLWSLYKRFQPEMFSLLEEIHRAYGKPNFKRVLKEIYPKLSKISFDNAILEKITTNDAMVISENLEWSDVGAWEALKEALQSTPDQNVIQGKVLVTDCQDSLIYNYTNQMVVTIDLNGFLVINTHDVVLICHKNSVPKIKKLVENLARSENDHLV
ncbi:mannose-1-phosphate guanylyltransferase [Candidatus Gottesmanbacteria bacterium]|nr:mannose-1-phosphate guanylyltransferase [Candidatus Gottesmanbacteria bacterium]